MSVLQAEELGVSLSGRRVLHDIDLDIHASEFVVLLGANGSGKTTLVRALLGLTPHDAGEVQLLGMPLPRFTEWHRLGYVPQRLALPTSVPATVAEVVLSGRIAHAGFWKPYSRKDREAAERALEHADLTELRHERVSRLSGGQQQRVLIARALATEPDVIVLDEPVSHVDVAHQTRFAELLQAAHENGATVILVAHELGKMAGLATRAIVLDAGGIVYDGVPEGTSLHDHEIHHHDSDERHVLRPIGGERWTS